MLHVNALSPQPCQGLNYEKDNFRVSASPSNFIRRLIVNSHHHSSRLNRRHHPEMGFSLLVAAAAALWTMLLHRFPPGIASSAVVVKTAAGMAAGGAGQNQNVRSTGRRATKWGAGKRVSYRLVPQWANKHCRCSGRKKIPYMQSAFVWNSSGPNNFSSLGLGWSYNFSS